MSWWLLTSIFNIFVGDLFNGYMWGSPTKVHLITLIFPGVLVRCVFLHPSRWGSVGRGVIRSSRLLSNSLHRARPFGRLQSWPYFRLQLHLLPQLPTLSRMAEARSGADTLSVVRAQVLRIDTAPPHAPWPITIDGDLQISSWGRILRSSHPRPMLNLAFNILRHVT